MQRHYPRAQHKLRYRRCVYSDPDRYSDGNSDDRRCGLQQPAKSESLRQGHPRKADFFAGPTGLRLQPVQVPSAAKTVTLTNPNKVSLGVTSVAPPASYTVTNDTCSGTKSRRTARAPSA